MILQAREKLDGYVTSRVKPIKETLLNAQQIASKIGVTRIADITNLDRLNIPNFSAVLPGTEDYIWVYSGKGYTKIHAETSALMETIERYSSLPKFYNKPFVTGSISDLSGKFDVLHPDDVVEPLLFDYNNDMKMDFINGFDLINKTNILVPAHLALFQYSPKYPCVDPFSLQHTNGLASGNVMEEAICHALCEVIERDAISIAELRCSAIPYHKLHTISTNLQFNKYNVSIIDKSNFVDDTSIYPDVEIDECDFLPLKKLVKRFRNAGISLIIKDITSDLGIPTFIATSVEWISHDYGYLAEGHGTHPDKRIAIIRAITEVSQTRAANIQGARDDLRKIKYNEHNTDDKFIWQFNKSKNKINYSEIISFENKDILDDIELILLKLKENGIERAIVVDLTNPLTQIPVVRIIVPGLETFKISKSIIGWRGKRYF